MMEREGGDGEGGDGAREVMERGRWWRVGVMEREGDYGGMGR